ncbi:MAG: hypothetical protein BGO29_15345 [Bacteroidales bacterium 36-12]|nr:MAG: hypothetical protein BGO29_15345 [Bacteroidales bacterium 36-12]
MNRLLQHSLFLILSGILFFTSCEQNEISRIAFDKSEISLLVGKYDTITVTVSYIGDISDMSMTWRIEDPTILSIQDISDLNNNTSKKSLTKTLAVKALKSGTSQFTVQIGEQSHVCDVTVNQKIFTFSGATASNWGDYYETETNNFEMLLYDNTISFNDEGRIIGNGNVLFLDFYLPLSYDTLLYTLSPEEFVLSTKRETHTFYPGESFEYDGDLYVVGTHIRQYTDDGIYATLINDGNFSITKKGSTFEVSGDLILEDDEIIQFSYEGIVNESDERNPEDIKADMTKGLLVYYGDAYNSKSTNNFNAFLGTDIVDFDSDLWEGDIFQLEFNTTLSVKDYIPEGTYNIINKNMDYITYDDLKPFTLMPGYYDESYNEWGTWFFGESIKKIKTGTMEVVKSGDDYVIEYEFFDRFGSRIWGTFEGQFKYIDGTKPSSQGAPAKVKARITDKRLLPSVKKASIDKKGLQLNQRRFKL